MSVQANAGQRWPGLSLHEQECVRSTAPHLRHVVKDEDGNVIKEGEKVYLCRCGFSANKPFCDGSHKREGWTSGD